MLRLYTFDISHFSEKARWALDYEGIAYEETVLLPGPHRLKTMRIARRSSVPILEHEGRFVQGSAAILDYIGDQLGGTKLLPKSEQAKARARELEAVVDHAFGLGAQRVLYSALLPDRKAVVKLWSANGPVWAPLFYTFAYPVVSAVVARMYKTHDPAAVEQSKRAYVETFDRLDALLADQPFFGGATPDRLDIAVAALLGPVCRPPEHRVKWPEVPSELVPLVSQLEGRPSWAHTLRMYREHRKRG